MMSELELIYIAPNTKSCANLMSTHTQTVTMRINENIALNEVNMIDSELYMRRNNKVAEAARCTLTRLGNALYFTDVTDVHRSATRRTTELDTMLATVAAVWSFLNTMDFSIISNIAIYWSQVSRCRNNPHLKTPGGI